MTDSPPPKPPSRTEPSETVLFGRRLAGSPEFWSLFAEGMALVEETATYLDGVGKLESRRLSRAGSVAFGTESMRLTTRLMQLASWLLLQRAINEGSVSAVRGDSERSKVRLGALSSGMEGPGWDDLPDTLRMLICRSVKLQDRVMALDRSLRAEPRPGEAGNPVGDAIGRLSDAFGPRRSSGPA